MFFYESFMDFFHFSALEMLLSDGYIVKNAKTRRKNGFSSQNQCGTAAGKCGNKIHRF
jgi:hypothetical protein